MYPGRTPRPVEPVGIEPTMPIVRTFDIPPQRPRVPGAPHQRAPGLFCCLRLRTCDQTGRRNDLTGLSLWSFFRLRIRVWCVFVGLNAYRVWAFDRVGRPFDPVSA